MKRIIHISVLAVLFFIPMVTLAQSSGGSNPIQKAEKKAESRWTLQGWLEQKDKNKMMDLWLSMNAPSPYEFFISGAYQDFLSKDETNLTEKHYNSGYYSAGAYSGIIGLEAFHEDNSQEKILHAGGSLNLRIVGNAVQGTHLIIQYGYKSMDMTLNSVATTVNQSFAGGDLNLYFTRHFGLSANYKYFIPVDSNTLGKVSGNRTEAGAFLDFSALRIFGSWFSDKQTITPAQQEKIVERTGLMSGIKIFF